MYNKNEALIVIIYSVYITVLTSHQSTKWKLHVKLMFTIREVFIIVFIYRITELGIRFFLMILITAFKMSAFPTNSAYLTLQDRHQEFIILFWLTFKCNAVGSLYLHGSMLNMWPVDQLLRWTRKSRNLKKEIPG